MIEEEESTETPGNFRARFPPWQLYQPKRDASCVISLTWPVSVV